MELRFILICCIISYESDREPFSVTEECLLYTGRLGLQGPNSSAVAAWEPSPIAESFTAVCGI